jgi:hypothetical protein
MVGTSCRKLSDDWYNASDVNIKRENAYQTYNNLFGYSFLAFWIFFLPIIFAFLYLKIIK